MEYHQFFSQARLIRSDTGSERNYYINMIDGRSGLQGAESPVSAALGG